MNSAVTIGNGHSYFLFMLSIISQITNRSKCHRNRIISIYVCMHGWRLLRVFQDTGYWEILFRDIRIFNYGMSESNNFPK